MKTRLIYILSFLTLATAQMGCRKKTNDTTPVKDVPRQAYVQWFNGTLNSTRNFMYVNGIQINGTTNSFGGVFPSGAYSSAVYSGSSGITIKDTLSTSTQVAQNFVQELETGKSYTIFTYDTITSPKRLIAENGTSVLNGTNARVRFLNIIYNPTPPPTVDIFSVNQNNFVVMNLPVAQLTNFFEIAPGVSDTWQVRQSGTTTVMASLAISTSSLMPNRRYTFVYRGSHRAAANRGAALIAN